MNLKPWFNKYIITGFAIPLTVMLVLGGGLAWYHISIQDAPANTPVVNSEAKPVATLGTYEFTSMHDETKPANVEVVVIYQKDNYQDYPYFYGYVDHDKMKAGDWWYSGAILRSDQKTKKLRWDPETNRLWYYMLTGDGVYTLYSAEPASVSTDI